MCPSDSRDCFGDDSALQLVKDDKTYDDLSPENMEEIYHRIKSCKEVGDEYQLQNNDVLRIRISIFCAGKAFYISHTHEKWAECLHTTVGVQGAVGFLNSSGQVS